MGGEEGRKGSGQRGRWVRGLRGRPQPQRAGEVAAARVKREGSVRIVISGGMVDSVSDAEASMAR